MTVPVRAVEDRVPSPARGGRARGAPACGPVKCQPGSNAAQRASDLPTVLRVLDVALVRVAAGFALLIEDLERVAAGFALAYDLGE